MKLLGKLSLAALGMFGIRYAGNLLSKYEVLIFDKNDLEDDIREESAIDLRGKPTHVCVCGSQSWYVKAVFDDYEIATYFLDMICSECGNLATAPTPLDREIQE